MFIFQAQMILLADSGERWDGLLIMNYQALLEAVMALSGADRGFVVLADLSTDEADQYVASHNLDPAWFQPIQEKITDDQYARQVLLPMMFKQHEPLLAHNAPTDDDGPRHKIIGWVLRSIIAVPLKQEDTVYGLLWCDKSVAQKGVWTEQDLQQVAALVQAYSE